jgi:Secretion system C-terminal sorting domain
LFKNIFLFKNITLLLPLTIISKKIIMKKLYTLAAGLILGGSIIGQSVLVDPIQAKHKGTMVSNSKHRPVTNTSGASRTSFGSWVEPVGDVMATKGIDLTGLTSGTSSQGTFIDIIYQDSTTVYSDASGTYPYIQNMMGTVLDPKSPNLVTSGNPYVTNADPYYLDSLFIIGSYVKVNSVVDTLYMWIVWGDSTNTSAAFTKRTTATTYVAPLATWRYEIIGPKVLGANGAPGNPIYSSAPTSNRMLIKYVLTNSDSVSSGGQTRGINIPLPSCIGIPAGNLVSCFYTFVPGAANALGDVSYTFGGAPQTVNGFAGEVWGQTYPVLTALADYQDQQVDPDGWNMGCTYSRKQRHAVYNTAWQNMIMGNMTTAPNIYYYISSQPTGVNELSNNNFALLQNQPNPFTNQTTVKYQLKKAASDVAVQVYDIRGVKVFEKAEKNLKAGSYSVEISDNTLSSGMYFCTLTVDGQKVTNKMMKK